MTTSYTVYGCPACGSTHPAGTVCNMLRQIVQGYARDMIEFDEERMRDIARSVFLESGENRVERVREIAREEIERDGLIRESDAHVAGLIADRDDLEKKLSACEKERDAAKVCLASETDQKHLARNEVVARRMERDSALAKLAASEKALDEIEACMREHSWPTLSMRDAAEALKRTGRLQP